MSLRRHREGPCLERTPSAAVRAALDLLAPTGEQAGDWHDVLQRAAVACDACPADSACPADRRPTGPGASRPARACSGRRPAGPAAPALRVVEAGDAAGWGTRRL